MTTEAFCLRTDGSNGAALKTLEAVEMEVGKGQTETIDASFLCEYTSDAEGGLDRFIVKVLHINHGGGAGNNEPGLIMIKEGVFCPPEYEAK